MQLISFQLSRIALVALMLSSSLILAGCASLAQPERERVGLKLAPAALGQSLSLQQHLIIERNGRIDELDAALDVDGARLELVGLAFGQRVLTLRYDGKELTEWRHKMLPSQVQAEDVLEDLQLTLWPVDAIAQALPDGWRISDQGLLRTLYREQQVVATIHYSEATRWSGTAVLDNLRYRYRLTIQAAP